MIRSTKFIFACIVGIILASCDILDGGTNTLNEPSFKTSNSLQERLFAGEGNNSDSKHSKQSYTTSSLDLTPIFGIETPTIDGNKSSATDLSFDNETEQLHVGYKTPGPKYAGGVDIIDFESFISSSKGHEENYTTVQSLRSIKGTNFDVQNVRFDSDNSLFIAGAVHIKDADATPSRISKVNLSSGSDLSSRSKSLSGFVAKSLILDNDNSSAYVVTDKTTLYKFSVASLTQNKKMQKGGANFRSVAYLGGEVWVMDKKGKVYTVGEDLSGSFETVADLNGTENIEKGNTIARLRIFDGSSSDRIIAALNEDGFTITNPNPSGGSTPTPSTSKDIYNSQQTNDNYYTSVSIRNRESAEDQLFAARPEGKIDVFTLSNSAPPYEGKVTFEQTFDLGNEFFEDWSFDAEFNQVNQILVYHNLLIVANSKSGVLVFSITGNTIGPNFAARKGCSDAVKGGVAFTNNGNLKYAEPSSGNGLVDVTTLLNTTNNSPVAALGTGVDLDKDGQVGVIYIQNGDIKIIDRNDANPTVYNVSPEPKTKKTLLAVGKWNNSEPSVFYVASTGNGDEIYRVSFNNGSTHRVANPGNGVDAVVGINDIDGDGKNELAFMGGSQQTRYINQNAPISGTFTKIKNGGVGSNNNIGLGSCLAKLDGSKQAQIPVVNGSNQIQLLDANGITHTIITGSDNEQAAKTPLAWSDIDADGKLELVYIENNSSPAELKYVDEVGSQNDFETLTNSDGSTIEASTNTGVVSAK